MHMKALLTILFAVTCYFSIAQEKSYKYSFEIDTLINTSNKSFLSEFTDQMMIYSRHVKGANSFEVISPENYTQEEFGQMVESLGLELTGFSKNHITYEYQSTEKNGGQDCPSAAIVCSNNSFSGNASGYGTQELNSGNDGCLSGENQSSWYYVNIGSDGILEMEIDPAAGDDYDWAIWGPFNENTANANCPPGSQPIRCSWAGTSDPTGMSDYWGVVGTYSYSCGPFGWFTCTDDVYGWVTPTDNSEGSGGNGWVAPLNVQEDEIYIMVIDNYSVSGDPFNLTWGGSAGLDCTTVPLPVELLSFSVSNQKTHNLIEWTTASEKNNDYFQIEYSTDGSNWQVIGELKGAGTTNSEQFYSSTHFEYRSTINYYRLVQVDYDGTINEHQIISIDNSKDRYIVKKVNSLGQDVGDDFKGVVFEYYSDGNTRKVMQ